MIPARFNRWWVGLWAGNTVALGALVPILRPGAWCAAFAVLFLAPEMVGLRRRGDSLPPLTYAVRRFAPRWVPDCATFALGAWVAGLWVPRATHPLVVIVVAAAFVGWLTNHWDVTYDGGGE